MILFSLCRMKESSIISAVRLKTASLPALSLIWQNKCFLHILLLYFLWKSLTFVYIIYKI